MKLQEDVLRLVSSKQPRRVVSVNICTLNMSTQNTFCRLACRDANADQPFMCLDLTFIWVLLEGGFGLGPETPLYVSAKFYLTFKGDSNVVFYSCLRK